MFLTCLRRAPFHVLPTDKSISSLLEAKCKSKEDFQALSSKIYQLLIARHASNPLFSSFVEHHVKEVCETLKDSEVRKAASGLSILANTKQQEQRDAKSGKKKVTKAKPGLGGGMKDRQCVCSPLSRSMEQTADKLSFRLLLQARHQCLRGGYGRVRSRPPSELSL